MANPDAIQRRPNPDDDRSPRPRRSRRVEDMEFRETLAPPIPNRTYRSEIDLTEDQMTKSERIFRIVASILAALLLVRLIVGFISTDRSHVFINILYGLTDWMIRPFQLFFNKPPVSGHGFFDVPAFIGLVIIYLVTRLVIRTLR